MPVNSNEFSAFDEALKKSEPAVAPQEQIDEFAAFDEALKKKEEPLKPSSKDLQVGVSDGTISTIEPPKKSKTEIIIGELQDIPVPTEQKGIQKPQELYMKDGAVTDISIIKEFEDFPKGAEELEIKRETGEIEKPYSKEKLLELRDQDYGAYKSKLNSVKTYFDIRENMGTGKANEFARLQFAAPTGNYIDDVSNFEYTKNKQKELIDESLTGESKQKALDRLSENEKNWVERAFTPQKAKEYISQKIKGDVEDLTTDEIKQKLGGGVINEAILNKYKEFVSPKNLEEGVVNDNSEKGSRLGFIYNSLLNGIGSVSSGASDIMMQLLTNILPEEAIGGEGTIDEKKEQALAKWREEAEPTIRTAMSDLYGAEVGENKQKKYEKEFFTSALSGLAGSVPMMVSPYGTGLFLGSYDAGLQMINNTDKGKDLPESTKTIFAAGVGTAGAILEKIGIDKIFGKQSKKVAINLAVKTLSELSEKSAVPITATIFEKALAANAQNLKNKIIGVGGKISKAAAVEFLTGSAQESANVLAEKLLNLSQKKEIFEPKSNGEIVGRILYAGAQEAVGGGIMGGISAFTSKTRNYISEKVSEAKSQEDIDKLKSEVLEQAQKNNIGEKETNDLVGLIDSYQKINSKVPQDIENRKEVIERINERDDLKNKIEEKKSEIQEADDAFKPDMLKDLEAMQGRYDEMNEEVLSIGKGEVKAELPTEEKVEAKKADIERRRQEEEKDFEKQGVEIYSKKYGLDPKMTGVIPEIYKSIYAKYGAELAALEDKKVGEVEAPKALSNVEETTKALEGVYKKQNPHSGGGLSGNPKAFDELPNDAEVYVYTATTIENAKAILSGKEIKPEMQGQGIKGESNKIYVASDPRVVSGMGKVIIGFKIKKSDLSLSPEAQKSKQTLGQSVITSGTGALLEGKPILSFIAETQDRINTSAKSGNEALSEAYHKAKTDGSNPELVKAVENLLVGEVTPTEVKPTAELPVEEKVTEEAKEEEITPMEVEGEEPPFVEGGVTIVSRSGLTEPQRQRLIEQRKKQTKVTERSKDQQSIIDDIEKYNRLPKGRLGKQKPEGLNLLNKIRLKVANFNEKHNANYSFDGYSLLNEKNRTVKRKTLEERDIEIDETGKTLRDRDLKTQQVFDDLIDKGSLMPTGYRADGLRMSDAQLEATLQDILDGVPSRRANNYLDALEKQIANDDFDFSKSDDMPEYMRPQITLDYALDVTREVATEPMSEEQIDKWLNEEAELTPENQEVYDNIDNLITRYETENESQREIPTTETRATTEGKREPAKIKPITEKPTTAERKVEPKPELPTAEKPITEEYSAKNLPKPTGEFEVVETIPYTEADKNKFKPEQQLKFNQGEKYEPIRIVGDADLIELIQIGARVINNLTGKTKKPINRERQKALESKYGISAYDANMKAKELAKQNRGDVENIIIIGEKPTTAERKFETKPELPIKEKTKPQQIAEGLLTHLGITPTEESEIKFSKKTGEPQTLTPKEDKEKDIVDQMNSMNLVNNGIDLSSPSTTKEKINISELNTRLDNPLNTVKWEDFIGIPFTFTISDQLRTGDIENPNTKEIITDLKGGIGFNGTKGNENNAWANTTKEEAEAMLQRAKDVYLNNKQLFEKLWEDGKLPNGHIPMAVVKMAETSILSNEAVFRIGIQNIETLPKSNRKKAVSELAKSMKAKIDTETNSLKRGVDKNGKPYTENTIKLKKKSIAQYQKILDIIRKNKYEDIVDVLKDKDNFSLPEKALIANEIFYGSPTPIGGREIDITRSRPNTPVSKVLIGNKNPSLINLGKITDLLTEPSMKNVPNMHIVSIVGIDIKNPNVNEINHKNYPYGVKGQSIGVLENPVHMKDAFGEAYGSALAQVVKNEADNSSISIKSALTQGIPVQAGLPNRVFKSAIAKGQLDAVDKLAGFLRQAFPSTTFFTSKEAWDAAMADPSIKKKLKEGDVVYAFTTDGNVFINPDLKTTKATLHETGHVWFSFIKENNPELHKKGLELVDGTKEYENAISQYGDTELAREEALMELMSTKGDTIINASQKAKFKEWLLSVYKYISNNFKSLMGLNAKEIENLTLDKFLDGMLADILSGKELTTKKIKGEVKFSLESQNDKIKKYIESQRKLGESETNIRAGLEYVANKLGLNSEDIDKLMSKKEIKSELPETKEITKEDKKEFDNLTSTIPNTGEVTKYLSGETIKKYEGEEARNEQEVFVQGLREALVRGVDIVNKARELFGDNYVQELLNYVETENLPPANKALIYVSLENEVAKQKIENPSKAQQLEKLQDLVRAKSQAFLRSSSLAINFGRLRKIAEIGYDVTRLTDDFFSSKQLEQKQSIEKAIQATPDEINKAAEELKRKIEEGVEEELAKIYEKLPKEKKSFADKAITALDKIQQQLRNKAYSDFTGMTALVDAGITTIKAALKAGVKLADAIEIGINKIREQYESKTGKKWEKEQEFREDITGAFKAEGIKEAKKEMSKSEFNRLEKEILELNRQIEKGEKDKFNKKETKESNELDKLRKEKEEKQAILEALDPTPKIFIENALIEQGYGRQINIKTKEGVEKRWVLDWKKLAGEEGSVDNIKEKVEAALRDKGYTEEQILRMKDAFVNEYNNLRASIIEKAMNEIAAKNKETITPEQKSAAKKLAEMYNYGLFDKDPIEYEMAIAKTLGMSVASQEAIKKVSEIGQIMSKIFSVNYEGKRLTENQLRTYIQNIEEKVKAISFEESMKEGNFWFKISNIFKMFMDMSQRMMLFTVKQALENPISGLFERFFSSIAYSKKIPTELNAQQRKLARDIYKEAIFQRGIGYGKVGTSFVAKGNIDTYLDKLPGNQLINAIVSTFMGKPILDAVDSGFKAKITQQKFTYNLIKILTQDRKVNGKIEKGMSLDEAKKYVAEKISGQSFENAKETARKIINKSNESAGKKIFNDSELFVNRLATDIVNASLVNGEKITEDMVDAAYNAAYKAAGRGLGHVANNPISEKVNTASGKIESKINDAIKEENYKRAAWLNFYSMFYRNVANPFVGGGTNWIVLKIEKTGLGLLSSFLFKRKITEKPDITTEKGAKQLEEYLYEEMKIRDKFMRGAVGGAVTVFTYLLMKGTDSDEKFEEWLKRNNWAKKYVYVFTPEVALALMASKAEKSFKKYLEALFNKNETFDKASMGIKAATYLLTGKKEEGYGKLGELMGGSIGTPIPWRFVRDGQQIYVGVKGGTPYRVDPKPSKSLLTGFLKGGFVDYLGYAPKDKDLVFGDKMNEPGVKMLIDNGLELPNAPKIEDIKINKDERHPEGIMTKAEGEEYIKIWSKKLIIGLNQIQVMLKDTKIKPTEEQFKELLGTAKEQATQNAKSIMVEKGKFEEKEKEEPIDFMEEITDMIKDIEPQ